MSHPLRRSSSAADAPTRVCLGGEDLDWLGGPSLLAAIDLRVHVAFAPDPEGDTLTIESTGALPARLVLHRATWKDPTGSELELARLCWLVAVARSTVAPGGQLSITSSAPAGAGLATSATTCVAALRAMSATDHLGCNDPSGLVRAAFDVERWFAGRPVGPMDFVPAVHGGTSIVETESEVITRVVPLELPPSTRFVVVDTRTQRDTGAVVAWKRRRATEGDPHVGRYVERTATLVGQQAQLLADGSGLEALGVTLDEAQAILAEDMQVSTPLIDACIDRLRTGGAYGAKLTGTGHGGCVVALTTADDAGRVASSVADLPVSAFVVEPAPSGVRPPFDAGSPEPLAGAEATP